MKRIDTCFFPLAFAGIMNTIVTSSALAGFVNSPAMAAEPAQPTASPPMSGRSIEAPSFKVYDGNGDGKVSLEEFKAKGGKERIFRAADADKNGSLSSEEFFQIK